MPYPYNPRAMYTTRDMVLAAIGINGGFDSVHGLVLTLFTAQFDITPWLEGGRLVRRVREYYYGGRPLVAGDWYIWNGLPWSNELDDAINGLVDEGIVVIGHQGPGVDSIRLGGTAGIPHLPGSVAGRLANALGRYVAYTPWGFRRLVRWLLGLEDLDKSLYLNGMSIRDYLGLIGTKLEVVSLS